MHKPLLTISASLTLAVPALASDLIIKSTLTGGYSADGTFANSPAFQNYRVGHSPVTTVAERRNFFNFDLAVYPPLTPGSIIAGSLNLYVPFFAPGITIDPGDGYISPDPFEVYHVTSTPFSPAELADPSNTPAIASAIFATLGTGAIVGDIAVSPADKGTFLSVPLTPGALMAINAAMGSTSISMGGRLTSLSFIPPDELVFGFTDLIAPHMEHKEPFLSLIVVPAPASLCPLAPTLLLALRRRR